MDGSKKARFEDHTAFRLLETISFVTFVYIPFHLEIVPHAMLPHA